MEEPKVAAIVLNYNGKELTLETLESLERMTYERVALVVVDNGSTDGSMEAVETTHPAVKVLRTEKNLGAAGGLNLGIEFALRQGYEYLLLLNNDIEVHPEMLSELVQAVEARADVGCAGPKIYYYEDRERLWSAGGVLRFKESITRERGMNALDQGQYDRTEEVDYINGCAMLVKSQVMREVGLWDPIYYLAVEDADWCTRMKRLGYRCLYVHTALLWHMVSRSTGVYKPGKTYQTGRSTAIFVRRYATSWQWMTFLLFITIAFPAAFLRELPRRNTAAVIAKLKGVLAGLRVPLTPPPGVG